MYTFLTVYFCIAAVLFTIILTFLLRQEYRTYTGAGATPPAKDIAFIVVCTLAISICWPIIPLIFIFF